MGDRRKDNGTIIMAAQERPAMPARKGDACIILLHPPGPDIGRRTPLEGSSYVFGREADADLVISRNSVSRRHARLARDETGWFVEDMGSTNGSFVNEERVERQYLRDGDQLRFGDAIFKFLSGTNIEAAYHEEIYRMTIVDGLTQVHNKRYFLDFLEREIASCHRHGHPLSLVMIDLDHFKAINDERGHLAGDAVLKDLSARIKGRIRREDLFARYGGEEFAAVLTVTALQGAVSFAEHLRQIVADTPFVFEGKFFTVTVSVGVATLHGETEIDAEALIKLADDNLYEAKRRGRNCCVPTFADVGM